MGFANFPIEQVATQVESSRDKPLLGAQLVHLLVVGPVHVAQGRVQACNYKKFSIQANN